MTMIRKMESSEASSVKKTAKSAFVGIERFFVGTPKEVIIALEDNIIVGGIMIKYIISHGHKIGYFDCAFIAPGYQGKGIGGILYQKTTQYLWDQGCTAISALVKDDNVGSWQLFLNNGLSRTTILEGFRKLGFLPMLRQYFSTPFPICNGMDFYLAAKDVTVMPKKSSSAMQIGSYLLINILLILFAYLHIPIPTDFTSFAGAFVTLMLGRILFGYIGSLFSKQRWQFRLNSGGAVISAFICLIGGFYPMIGNWYPPKYEKTHAFQKTVGITALCEWCFIYFITIFALTFQSASVYFNSIASIGTYFLLYNIIAVYPFESFGGRRVYLWNKGVFAVLSVFSAIVVIGG